MYLILYQNIYNDIYIYILSSTDRPVSFYQNSLVWLDRLDSRCWDRNPVDSNANPRFYHSATRKLAQEKKFKRLCITIVFVYIYPLNRYRELDSYEKPCITLVVTIYFPRWRAQPYRGREYIYIIRSSSGQKTDVKSFGVIPGSS